MLEKYAVAVAAMLTGLLGESWSRSPGDFAAQREWMEEVDASLSQAESMSATVTGMDESLTFGELTVYQTRAGRVYAVRNVLPASRARSTTMQWYLDVQGRLVAYRERSVSLQEDGARHHDEEDAFFAEGALFAIVGRSGEVPPFRSKDTALSSEVTMASEIEQVAAVEMHDYHESRMQAAIRVVRAAEVCGNDWPMNLLLKSLSPQGRYGVTWRSRGEEGEAAFQLVRLQDDTVLATLPEGLAPGSNHMDHWASWSPGARKFIFGMDAKWSTMDAWLYEVSEASAREVCDLNAEVTKLAWQELKQIDHPYARHGEGIHGFLRIEGLSDEGQVNALLVTESKLEGPDHNVVTEVQLRVSEKGKSVLRLNAAVREEPRDAP